MRVKLEDDLRDAIINGACDTDLSVNAFVNALLRQHHTAHHPAEAVVSLLKEALFASKFTVVEGDAETRALRKLVLEAYAPTADTADDILAVLEGALPAHKFIVSVGDAETRALRKQVLEAHAPTPTVDTSSLESVLGDLYATHLFDHTSPGMLGIIAAVLKTPVKTETPCPCCGKHYVRAYGIQVTCDAPKCREWVRLALINQAEAVSCAL